MIRPEKDGGQGESLASAHMRKRLSLSYLSCLALRRGAALWCGTHRDDVSAEHCGERLEADDGQPRARRHAVRHVARRQPAEPAAAAATAQGLTLVHF